MSALQNGDIPVNTVMITTFMIKIKCNSSESAYSSQSLIYQCQTCNIKLNGLLKNNLIYNAFKKQITNEAVLNILKLKEQ